LAANITLEKLRKAQILDAAVQMISANGSHNVTLDDVAKAAELSKGGVAYYFSSKDELFREAFVEFFGRIFDRGLTTMAQFDDPLEKLLSFGWLFNDHEAIIRDVGYPLIFDCMARAVRDDAYRQIFHDWVENWVRLLREALDLGVDQGRFQVADSELAARAISSIYHGYAIRWYLDRPNHSTAWAREHCRVSIKRYLGC